MANRFFKAPELRVKDWIDENGERTAPIKFADFKGKYKVLFCFQHWCPGCHSVGFPSLQKLVSAFKESDKIVFFAVQTVFEGANQNTYEKILEAQKRYDLAIPFGHDAGDGRSTIMQDYQTGGTPWFIFIDDEENVFFADFHIDVDEVIKYLQDIK